MFDQHIAQELGYYVYRLVDPRNGETFYVGKGKGNRVFQHAQSELKNEDDIASLKLQRIRRIRLDGHEVQTIIHRHGMDEDTAYHVEAALIDAYPGLSNDQGGHNNDDFGVRSAEQVIRQYSLEEADLSGHSYLIINITRCFENAVFDNAYDCARFAWKLNPERAQKMEYILAVSHGVIVGVFEAEAWLPTTSKNFPSRNTIDGRWGFVGKEAAPDVTSKLMDKKTPNEFRKRGAANPIQYVEKEGKNND